MILRRSFHRDFQALEDVSFTVEEGRTLGIIGQNGAGKSTLLKILTGIVLPDSGAIEIKGRITGLLELGTGFNGEFSGIDNIFLNGTYLGLSRDELKERLEAIVGFTELGKFIHEPIKTYSSGMVMRLAFSVAIHADPKCFVVDEALSVGDAYFQQKCMKRIRDFKAAGGSIIFVSHDMNAVKMLCDEALLLDHGVVVDQGAPDKIIERYNYLISRLSGEAVSQPAHHCNGYGNHKVTIDRVRLLNEFDQDIEVLLSGKPAKVCLRLHANVDVAAFHVGILFRDKFGQDIFGTNTFHLKRSLSLKAGEDCELTYFFERFNLGPGKYTLTVAAHGDDTHINDCHHWIDRSLAFEVVHGDGFVFVGFTRLEPAVYVNSER
ncbi:MAG: ABC transporter ATP-binding protein [Pseudomonadota bacterium]